MAGTSSESPEGAAGSWVRRLGGATAALALASTAGMFAVGNPGGAPDRPPVAAATDAVTRPAVTRPAVTRAAAAPAKPASSSCPVAACVTLSGNAGRANAHANGVLESSYPGLDNYDTGQLKSDLYRGDPVPVGSGIYRAGAYDWSSFRVALATGQKTILMLSGLYDATTTRPATPWSNWSRYEQWVRETARAVRASGIRIDYWEVFNEPGEFGYYTPAAWKKMTASDLEQQFLISYRVIKSIIPSARFIGPSLAHFETVPRGHADGKSPDLPQFLQFCVANHIKLAALAWHEYDDTPLPNRNAGALRPAQIETNVAAMRRIIATMPAIGHPQIFIDEYSEPEVEQIPGWEVEYLEALTRAHVDQAVRSCWNNECASPQLDGLLDGEGSAAYPVFWESVFYADMAGQTELRTRSTSDVVAAIGAYAKDQAEVLVGYGDGCDDRTSLGYNPVWSTWCSSSDPSQTLVAPKDIRISVTVPWTGLSIARAEVTTYSTVKKATTAAPPPATYPVTVTRLADGEATLRVVINGVSDGYALGIQFSQ